MSTKGFQIRIVPIIVSSCIIQWISMLPPRRYQVSLEMNNPTNLTCKWVLHFLTLQHFSMPKPQTWFYVWLFLLSSAIWLIPFLCSRTLMEIVFVCSWFREGLKCWALEVGYCMCRVWRFSFVTCSWHVINVFFKSKNKNYIAFFADMICH